MYIMAYSTNSEISYFSSILIIGVNIVTIDCEKLITSDTVNKCLTN